MFVHLIHVKSAQDMFEAVTAISNQQDIIIMTAAVADFTPAEPAEQKIKKSGDHSEIRLKRTQDILKYLGEHKPDQQFLCGFSMETENMLENSRKKLQSKHCDMICANSLTQEGAGFGTDTNILTIITMQSEIALPMLSKEEIAHKILDQIMQ